MPPDIADALDRAADLIVMEGWADRTLAGAIPLGDAPHDAVHAIVLGAEHLGLDPRPEMTRRVGDLWDWNDHPHRNADDIVLELRIVADARRAGHLIPPRRWLRGVR